MRRLKRKLLFFGIGAIGYGIIEILWRGYTHWAMLVAGGLCFMVFSYIAEEYKRRSLIFKALLCAVAVTFIEMVFGFTFNILLGTKIWDYSNQPFNFMGQICALYSLLWGVLGFIFIPLAEFLNKKLIRQ